MNRQIERSVIMILLTIVIIILSLVNNTIVQTITIQNYTLQLNSVIIVGVLILLNFIKSNKDLAVSFSFSRNSNVRLLTLLSYYFYIFSLLSILIYNRDITLLFAIIIIFTEVLIIILNLVIYNIQNRHLFNRTLLRIKDATFFLMCAVLILGNIPFEYYSIPFDLILIVIYIIINVLIVDNLRHEYINVTKV